MGFKRTRFVRGSQCRGRSERGNAEFIMGAFILACVCAAFVYIVDWIYQTKEARIGRPITMDAYGGHVVRQHYYTIKVDG